MPEQTKPKRNFAPPSSRAAAASRPLAPVPTDAPPLVDAAAVLERERAVKQGVLADVSCVLARANGADIDARQAFAAARNVCEILFSHHQRPHTEIPKLFWETPLGRAVGLCCGDRDESDETAAALPPREAVETVVTLPFPLTERLRLEAEMQNKTLSQVVADRLNK